MRQLLTIIVILVLVGVGLYVVVNTGSEERVSPANNEATSRSSTATNTEASTGVATSTDAATTTRTVTYSGGTFTPSSLTIEKGETVVFRNESGSKMWVASDAHPTHTEYDGSSLGDHCEGGTGESFDQCAAGDIYRFTFERSGSWEYHNHLNPTAVGTVVVE